jgi:serine/threonine-protein kinase HipA
MRQAKVFVHGDLAGLFEEVETKKRFRFIYNKGYSGAPISLALPVRDGSYEFNQFPPFFDGLLPEGLQLEGLLKEQKIDKDDYFSQIVAVGRDLVGAVTVEAFDE